MRPRRERSRVTVTYRKVRVTPSARARKKHPTNNYAGELGIPKERKPLIRYVLDNLSTGISVPELIEQFQEYDCEHFMESLATSTTKDMVICPQCGLIEVKVK